MNPNFELGNKHTEYKQKTEAIVKELSTESTKNIVLSLREKAIGLLPKNNALYDDYLGLVASVEEIARTQAKAASLIVDQIIVQEIYNRYLNINNFDKNSIYAVLCSESGIATLKSIKTTAKKSSTGFEITGTKQITKEQLEADKFFVFAKDEEENIRIFELTKDQISLSQVEREVAGKNLKLNQIEINTQVADSIIVVDSKYENVQAVSRILVAAVAMGIAHNALIAGISSTKQTKGFDGLPISSTQSIQFQLADLFAELEAGKVLTYNGACLMDAGKSAIKFATMAKVQATNAAAKISMDAMQLLGNIGYLADNEFATILESAFNTQIKGGTNRVQKKQIYDYMFAKK